jgi:ribose/xylose/arabinose/galactoside ABC-type transport system permease subunit
MRSSSSLGTAPASVTVAPAKQPRAFRLPLLESQEATLFVFLVILIVGMSIINPTFLDPQNVKDILVNSFEVAVIAVGMTMVIVSGNIDISVGSILGLCAVLAGRAAIDGIPLALNLLKPLGISESALMLVLIAFVVLFAMVAGLLMGMLNGFLVAFARIPAIIVTLGTLSLWRGVNILYTRGEWVQNMPDEFHFAQARFLEVPVPVWLMVITVAVAAYWMSNSVVGREIYAVGGNSQAARLAGVNVRRMTFLVFAINGLLSGLAGYIYASRLSFVQSNAGSGLELVVITACVIGGVSILGGSGSILGAFLGTLLLGVIGTGLVFMKVSAYWVPSLQGSLILLAVLLDVWRRRRSE